MKRKIEFVITAVLWATVIVGVFSMKEGICGLLDAGASAFVPALERGYATATRIDNLIMALCVGLIINWVRLIPSWLKSLRHRRH